MSAPKAAFISKAASKWIFGVLVAVAAIAFAATVLARTQNWTPDGLVYTQRMLEDTGLPARAAQLRVRAFYATQPLAHDLRYQNLLTDHPPPTFRQLYLIFAPRFVYPYVSSLFYPRLGFDAMLVVSRAAYVLAVISLFVFLAYLAPPWLAALGAAAFGVLPEIRLLADSVLTDMPAVALWIAVCAAMAAYFTSRSRAALGVFAALCVILAFTRPIVHLPLGAALAVWLYAWVRRERRLRNAAFVLAAVTCAVAAVYVLASVMLHAPGVLATVHWGYDHKLELGGPATPSYGAWYLGTIGVMARSELSGLVRSGRALAWLFIIVCTFARPGRWLPAARWAAPLCLGAGVASIASLLLDPVPSDLQRVVEAPILPMEITGFVLGVQLGLQWLRRS